MTRHRSSSKLHGRRTIDKLLDAAIYLFDAGGDLAGCTVENVAAEARVSQGRIFRRYNSNDSFLSALFLRYLDRIRSIGPEELFASLYRPSLEDTAERVVTTLVRPYQVHPQLYRALDQFQQLRPETDFTAQAPELIAEYMRKLAAILVPHRSLIAHPDPERAAMIAVLQAAAAIEDTFLLSGTNWDKTLPRTTQFFIAERTRALTAYLRSMPEAGPRRTPPAPDPEA